MIALVTGASGGIGLEIARLLAADAYDIILVARSKERLDAVAAELSARHAVRTLALPADLSLPGAAADLLREIPDGWQKIDVLVNNAGFGTYGPFAETPVDEILGMMRLNMEALAHLTRLVLPSMLAARRGRILNVSSVAGFTSGPLMAAYYATKAFELHLSEAIAEEVAGSGVTVTVLCPGPTATGFGARAKIGRSRLNRFVPPMSAAAVARIGYRAMLRGKPVAVAGLGNRAIVFFVRLLPRRFAVRVVLRLQASRGLGRNR
jgi:short-subunit dehydrogenase